MGSGDLEIITSNRSKVEASPTKSFQLPINSSDPQFGTEVQLNELHALAINQHVAVSIKVIDVGEPMPITTKADKKLTKYRSRFSWHHSNCSVARQRGQTTGGHMLLTGKLDRSFLRGCSILVFLRCENHRNR